MREVVLDTETTGLNTKIDRIVEIGLIELSNHIPTGKVMQAYVNPMWRIDEEAIAVHGLTQAFLMKYPPFHEIAAEVIAFIGGSPVIAHNASFDVEILRNEIERAGALWPPVEVIDTLSMARRRFPSGSVSLDALCKRLDVSTAHRTYHGALLDAELLAECYVRLHGGGQATLDLKAGEDKVDLSSRNNYLRAGDRHFGASQEEIEAHRQAIQERIKEPIWASYL